MLIAEQKCIGSLRARVDGRLIRNTFFIGSKVIRYRVNGVLSKLVIFEDITEWPKVSTLVLGILF